MGFHSEPGLPGVLDCRPMQTPIPPRFLVVQHHRLETLGTIAAVLGQSQLQVVRADQGEPVPADLRDTTGLILLGGPQAVYQQDRYAYLRAELRLIEQALQGRLPVLGICLGSQLLATALGAAVRPATHKEIGWHPVQLTEDDPMFAGIPRRFMGLHWHGDSFELPAGAVSLARSELTEHQAFQFGGHAYGLLMHLEMTEDQLVAMVQEFGAELTQAGIDGGAILAESPRYLGGLSRIGRRVFGYWAGLAGLPGGLVGPKVDS